MRTLLSPFLFLLLCSVTVVAQLNPNPPSSPVRLVFIHHSVGEDWLNPDHGNLIKSLNDNNYYVRDTNYDWGPLDEDVNDGANVGSHTDIGHWYNWFLGTHRTTYLQALYTNDVLTSGIENSASINDPGGENRIVMFKSCFLAAHVMYGEPNDAPTPKGIPNPLCGRGIDADTDQTVANVKGLYRDVLDYFATRQDKLFVLITTPPSFQGEVDENMPRLRGINRWLIDHWLENYPYKNVFVFDFHNVLTSNGGNPNSNDLGASTGAHHRYRNGKIEYLAGTSDFLAYASYDPGSQSWDSHPTAAGDQKAAAEFLPLLNIAYNRWKSATEIQEINSARRIFSLEQNYPNPFSVRTTIEFILPATGEISLKAYDVLGRETTLIAAQEFRAGHHSVQFDASNIPSGMYLLSLETEGMRQTRKMHVLK